MPRLGRPTCRIDSLFLGTILSTCLCFSGCGRSAAGTTQIARPTRTAQAPTAPVIETPERLIARDVQWLRARSFTPNSHASAQLPGGVTLTAFHSVCTGSADGHCQAIDIFVDVTGQHVWHHQFDEVRYLRRAPGGFVINYLTFTAQDPLCCPSLPPRTEVLTWTGARIAVSQAPAK